MDLLETTFPDDPALDAAFAAALVARAAADPDATAVARVYTPARTLAFGRLDTLRPGFPDAVAAARDHGFAPVLRAPGGHAAAYHEQTLVLEVVAPDPDAVAGVRPRFEAAAARLAAVLRDLGADARVGPVPGEYCPGDWTVNGAGRVKLAGIAQRLVAGAWLVGAELVVADPGPIRAVLTDVHAALGMAFDPATAAAVADLAPAVTVDGARAAILHALGDPEPAAPADRVVRDAQRRRARHAV